MFRPLYLCEDYLVCDEGYVLGKNGKKLKPSLNHSGYEIINIMVNGERTGLSVHTAVMMSFCGEGRLDETYQVNHIDGNKQNNHISNLEWVTPQENVQHSVNVLGNNCGTNNANTKGILGVHKKTNNQLRFDTLIDAGRYFNPSNSRYGQTNIWKALSGKYKSAYGYVWSYI